MHARRLLTTVLAVSTAAVPLAAAPAATAAPTRAAVAAGTTTASTSTTASGTAKKPVAKKAPTRKPSSKKVTAKRPIAKKTAKRTAAKKTAAKRTTAKRPATTRTTSTKTVAKAPANKTPTKAPARKTLAKKTPVRKTRTTGKVVYLTFDDGPTAAYTPQVLQILARHKAKATFFVIGQQAAARPDLVRRARAAGHAVGSHTWDHPNLTTLSAAQVSSQLTRTNATLGRVTCMRPPYGAVNANVGAIARRVGLTPVLWNVDSRDWTRPGAAAITTNALAAPAGGGAPVILFHDGGGPRTQTVAALPSVIESYARRGYRFETLPTCR